MKHSPGCGCCGGSSSCPCTNNPASFTSVEIAIPSLSPPSPLLPCGGSSPTIGTYAGATVVLDPADWFGCVTPTDCTPLTGANPYGTYQLPGVTFSLGAFAYVADDIGQYIETLCSGAYVCTAKAALRYDPGATCFGARIAFQANAKAIPAAIPGFAAAANYACPLFLLCIVWQDPLGLGTVWTLDKYLWYKDTSGATTYDCTGNLAYYGHAQRLWTSSSNTAGPCGAFYTGLSDVTVTAVP